MCSTLKAKCIKESVQLCDVVLTGQVKRELTNGFYNKSDGGQNRF